MRRTDSVLGLDNSTISGNSTVHMSSENNFVISGEGLGGQYKGKLKD